MFFSNARWEMEWPDRRGFDGGLEVAAAVTQGGRLQEWPTVEVGEEIVGACRGAVDGDDPEVFRPGSRTVGCRHRS